MIAIRKIKSILKWCFASPENYAKFLGAKIGKGCYISTKGFPSEAYLIEIADNVRIAPKTNFYTHGGTWTLRKIYNDPKLDHFGKIKIGEYAYIGESCLIMPGVTIGSHCIVGAGSVVTRSVPDGCMVAGNPARFIGFTADYYKRLKEKYDLGICGMEYDEKRKFLLSQPDAVFEHKKELEVNMGKD